MARNLDIVVFGATGDTGVVACACLQFQGKKLGISRWAPAARNLSKLKKDVLDRLECVKPGDDGILPSEPIQADGGDFESLVKMCSSTKCVVACAGPYSLYGEGVVKACVQAGTNYVDITGETPWVEKMVRKYGEEAESKGISLVSCAGYDSIPPDLTACLAAKACEKAGDSLQRFDAFVGGSGGALPTGTLNTVLEGVGQMKRQCLRTLTLGMLGQEPQKELLQSDTAPSKAPSPAGKRTFVPPSEESNRKRNLFWSMLPGYSQLGGQFCIPHFMAPINVVTVHHTASKEGYGGFEYRERMGLGAPKIWTLYGLIPMLIGIGAAAFVLAFAAMPGFAVLAVKLRDTFNTPLQQNVRKRVLDGFRRTGKTYVHGYGISKGGKRVTVKLQSNYDPGLGFTMLSACTVAAQIVKRFGTASPAKPGFNSAVVALGSDSLADALRAMGISIDVQS